HGLQAGHWHQVSRWIEVVQVGEQIPESVANFSIGLGCAIDDLRADAHLITRVDHRDPEPQDIGPAVRDHELRRDDVAVRFRHLPPLFVDDEAVSQDLTVRRLAASADANQQGRLEPAPVLVSTLEIQVSWPIEFVPQSQDGLMAGTQAEPPVKDVPFPFEAYATT